VSEEDAEQAVRADLRGLRSRDHFIYT
jgi:hypothetical protein